jgi:hypothetical protein
VIVVLMVVLVMSNNHRVDQERTVAQHAKMVHSAHASVSGNDAEKEMIDPARKKTPAIENSSLTNMPNGAAAASADAIRNQAGPSPQDRFADIYFSIANKFADYQLWQIALEYYYRVFEKNPGYPELSAHIAEMKSEINNQITYEKGHDLITKEHYQEGIGNLHRIPENSYYFHKAAKFIAEAEENLMQAKKINEENRQGQSSNPDESR